MRSMLLASCLCALAVVPSLSADPFLAPVSLESDFCGAARDDGLLGRGDALVVYGLPGVESEFFVCFGRRSFASVGAAPVRGGGVFYELRLESAAPEAGQRIASLVPLPSGLGDGAGLRVASFGRLPGVLGDDE